MPDTHYIYGAGLHGCLYQCCGVCDTYEAAVEVLAHIHELGRGRTRQLKRDGYLELVLLRDGNEYCEIVKCTCGDPTQHGETAGQPLG